jgi:electron transfer flavoprotein beta subunit
VKILVPIKRVVDYNVKIKVNAAQTDVDTQHVKMSINPFCEIALEEALRLREAGVATEVVVVSIGTDAVIEQLRTGLALGADRAIHVQAPDQLEALHIAKILHKVVAQESPELVILGKQAIDSDNNQTGQMLAALAGMGQGTFASNVAINDGAVHVTREVDGGLQTLALTLPAVITTDLRLNEPRYATLPNIMKAKRKPIDTLALDALEVTHTAMLSTVKVEPPATRQAGVRVENVDELIQKLKTEAKVIA